MANGKAHQVAPAVPSNGVLVPAIPPNAGVNRKKAKRRAKQAAKLAQEQSEDTDPNASLRNGHVSQGQSTVQNGSALPQASQPTLDYEDDFEDPDQFEPVDGDDLYYTDDEGQPYTHTYDPNLPPANGHFGDPYASAGATGKKSKKKKRSGYSDHHGWELPSGSSSGMLPGSHVRPPPPPPPPLSSAALRSVQRSASSKDRIWNTSTQEERERIRDFWLSLSEDERKSLVKIEKEAVLRKMKEQQKHSCSCTVCGRKRTAIEEELEVLYDAYYEELELHGQDRLPPDRLNPVRPPYRPEGRIEGELESDEEPEDEDEEEELEEDDDYSNAEEYSDEDPEDLPRGGPAADLFNFGNSLTVKVADDLLKNDGKKFIEMMEQLAERRMQREDQVLEVSMLMTQQDTMTEQQRMREGRRMFQIFAARMFEQRVLSAYREKVANERQQKLIEELDEESRRSAEKEARKAKEAQKKRDKKAQQKQRQAEEKARKEAEKKAEEEAARALEEKKHEEQRRKREEQRKKKEAERKAQEEEKQRKEAEKRKRLEEERKRQQEAERKAQELKAQEKRAREEAKKKERDEREAREREAREQKAHADQQRKEREMRLKAEKESREQARREEQARLDKERAQTQSKRQSQNAPVALPSGLLSKQPSAGMPSPQVQVATPNLPKAPTPMRPRQSSQQGSHASSPKTPAVHPGSSKSISPSNASSQQPATQPKTILQKPQNQPQSSTLHHPQPASPFPIGPPPGMPHHSGFNGFPVGLNGPSPVGQMHGINRPAGQMPMRTGMPLFPHGPPMSQAFGQYVPNGIPGPPPGMGLGRGFGMDVPPGFSSPIAAPHIPAFSGAQNAMPSHSRQASASGSFDSVPVSGAPAYPIARPTPIQRPSSVKPHEVSQENRKPINTDIDDLSNHLGSSALLDDSSDEPFPNSAADVRRGSMAPAARSSRLFGTSPLFADGPGQGRMDSFGLPSTGASAWNTPAMPFGPPSMSSATWGTSPTSTGGWPTSMSNAFVGHRASISRPGAVRLMVCQACKQLAGTTPSADGFYDLPAILRAIENFRSPSDAQVQQDEVIDICETEGDQHNGGGFLLRKDLPDGGTAVKFEPDSPSANKGMRGTIAAGLGEIGSPVPGHVAPFRAAFPNLGVGGVSAAPGF
ncbi:hypothetical protein K490DRAFT_57620 [Saccharata proteae CBS 121410]|uniref:Stress response protein NST1 n=1 Tax=Saccharata proteae CBS 121410 TaxID=1314787 RepID=A0A9P4HUI4_9PEZI|nr:hypothetical protein K490DRAFT_57620 [Saccharata proteae CBS 121410]